MAAMAEFAARHPGCAPEDGFAADELAAELHLTPLSAAEQMHYASTVADRLPRTFAALGAGRIHPVHVRIIEDETRFLAGAQAATANTVLAGSAPGQTFGELRHAAHKLVLLLDPETAKKRKEAARGEAHVRRFRENSGNAGMVARELPSGEVLASWQHVEQRALDLRAAGMPGTLQELRVRAYLDLLQERDSRDLPAGGGGADPGQPPPGSEPRPRPAAIPDPTTPDLTDPAGTAARAPGPAARGPRQERPGPPRSGPGGRAEPGRAGHHHHPVRHLPGPVRGTGGGRRVRPPGRRRRPRPGRRRRPPPPHPVVHHRGEPRRHRRRARLPARPAPPARHRAPRPAARPGRPADPRRPRPLRPRPRRDRLPPQPRPPAPDPRPQRPRAPRRAAPGPRPAATWTTPAPGTRAAPPANATSRLFVDTITGVSRPKGGG